jgi:hypothetical protein
MRLFLPLVASLLLTAMPLPVQSKTAPVKSAVQAQPPLARA